MNFLPSFPRRRESRAAVIAWTPACAGVTDMLAAGQKSFTEFDTAPSQDRVVGQALAASRGRSQVHTAPRLGEKRKARTKNPVQTRTTAAPEATLT